MRNQASSLHQIKRNNANPSQGCNALNELSGHPPHCLPLPCTLGGPPGQVGGPTEAARQGQRAAPHLPQHALHAGRQGCALLCGVQQHGAAHHQVGGDEETPVPELFKRLWFVPAAWIETREAICAHDLIGSPSFALAHVGQPASNTRIRKRT
jgi:hypothetical protein